MNERVKSPARAKPSRSQPRRSGKAGRSLRPPVRRSGQEEVGPAPGADDLGAGACWRRRRLFLPDRRALCRNRQRLCAAGQGRHFGRCRGPHRLGFGCMKTRSSTAGDVLFTIDPEPYRIALEPGRCGACRAPGSMSSSCASPMARPRPSSMRAKATLDIRQREWDRKASLLDAGPRGRSGARRCRGIAFQTRRNQCLAGAAGTWPAPKRPWLAIRRSRSMIIRPCVRRWPPSDSAAAQPRQDHGRGSGRRHRQPGGEPQCRPVHRHRHDHCEPGGDRRHLGRGQFQGNPARRA